jgi:hypothetical protein
MKENKFLGICSVFAKFKNVNLVLIVCLEFPLSKIEVKKKER